MIMELSDDFTKAKTHALKIIALRDHCGGELLKKLGKYYDEKTCREALAYIREIGYQDDEKYAEKLAAHLIEIKHCGVRKARWEMKLKGLSEDTINAALEKYGEDEIQCKIAELIKRRYAENLSDRAGVKKTVDALMRRGYDYADIKAGIERVRKDIELDYD